MENSQQQVPEKKIRRTPWWVSILWAIGVYCGLKYVLPQLNPENETLRELFAIGPVAAPVLTIPLLLLAAKQLYDVEPDSDETDVEESQEP